MTLNRRRFVTGITAAAASLQLLPAAKGQTATSTAGTDSLTTMPTEPARIAMLLYPGFTALDFVGPYHFLGGMPGSEVHLVTNQADLSPVASDIGMAIQPTATLADCPTDLTVIFTPGGTIGTVAAARDPATIEFMRDRGASAKYITSVCTGSLILGAAGLLQGNLATSHWAVLSNLAQFGATPVAERVVRDGNLITGAGVSAGLDFGITLVEEIRGRTAAEAGVLISEYAPEPPIVGGTLDSARPEIAALLTEALRPFVDEASSLRIAS